MKCAQNAHNCSCKLRQKIGAERHRIDSFIGQNHDGEDLATVVLAVPDIEIGIAGLLQLRATDLLARYQPTSPPKLSIQGTVTVPQFYNLTGDFSGDNYIAFGEEGWDMVGQVSMEELARLDVDAIIDRNRLTATGAIELVGGLASGSGSVEVDYSPSALKCQADYSLMAGLMTINSSFSANAHLDVTMLGQASLQFRTAHMPIRRQLEYYDEYLLGLLRGLEQQDLADRALLVVSDFTALASSATSAAVRAWR